MKKTFLILIFLISSIFAIGQNQFSTGNMGKFLRVGSNFRYIPYPGLHYTMMCDSVYFIADNSSITSGNGFMWERSAIGSNFIKTKFSRNVMVDSLFYNDSIRIAVFNDANSNICLGYSTGIYLNGGTYNTFIGRESGYYNTTGQDNSFLGYYSGTGNTIGVNNTFIGSRSGEQNTTGVDNTYLGVLTGNGMGSNGNRNVFIGAYAGRNTGNDSDKFVLNNRIVANKADNYSKSLMSGVFSSTTASQQLTINAQTKVSYSLMVYNSFLGNLDTVCTKNDTTPTDGLATKKRLRDNYSTISDRIFGDKWTLAFPGSTYIQTKNNKQVILDSIFSTDSVRLFASDSYNLFVGYGAGLKNDASINQFVGVNSGAANTTGQYNLFVGYESGRSNINGLANTFVGMQSGGSNTSGSYNTFIGYIAGANHSTGSNNIFIGYSAGENYISGSNYLSINSLQRGLIGTDSLNSIIFGWQHSTTTNQRLYLNANVFVKHTLLVGGDSIFKKSDTTASNGLANKVWVTGKFSTIADRIAGDKWGSVAPGSGYINVLNSKRVILGTLYTIDSLDIFNVSTSNILIGQGGKRDMSGTGNIILGNSTTGDAITSSSNNLIMGYNAGSAITSTASGLNVFLGYSSGAASTGGANVFIGSNAGKYMTSENYRIILDNRQRGTKLLDSTNAPVYIYSAATMGDQIFYHNGNVVYTPVNTGNVVAGTGITKAMFGYIMLYNGGSAIDISANPQIVAGTPGQKIMIIGTSDTNTLTLENGTGIVCPGTRVLGINDVWQTVYITGQGWVEISFTNN